MLYDAIFFDEVRAVTLQKMAIDGTNPGADAPVRADPAEKIRYVF